MSLSFPTTGLIANVTTYTYGGTTWLWDGSEWNIYSNPSPTFVSPTATGTLTVNNLTVTGTATGVATALQIAGTGPSGTLGGVRVDGTTISINANGVISGSNSYALPKAIAQTVGGGQLGGVIPDGTTITINSITGVISGAPAYTLPAASSSTLGGVTVSSTSGLALGTSGQLSVTTAIPANLSGGQLGGVIPDGTTITINAGVISGYPGYTLTAATTSSLGGVIIPITANSGFTNSSGTIRLATASTTQLGGVKVDGATILINSSGVISAQITGAIVFQGSWNAYTNTPFLVNGVGTNGFEYVVTTAGTVNFGAGNVTFVVGDNVIYNGSVWVRVPLGASSGTTQNSVTFASSGGASSGTTFNGSGAVTVSYSTVGAEIAGGSSDITTVGTITSGTWNGSIIPSQYGGTGVNNSPYTITVTSASQTLNQSVASGAAPQFVGTNFSQIPVSALSYDYITFGAQATSLGGTISSFNNITIGDTTPTTGSFTTITSTGPVAYNTTTNNQSYTTSGSGTITIRSGTAGSINNMNIGASTAGTGAFTSLSASSTVSGTGFSTYLASPPAIGGTAPAAGSFTQLTVTGSNVSTTLSPTGTGSVTINPATIGSIDNMNIGSTTAGTGRFTTITSTVGTGTAPFTVASTTNVANLNASYLNGATFAAPGTIGGGTPGQVNTTNIVQTSSGVHYFQQPAVTALTATSILTIAQLLTLIITISSTTATTLTLPTGALTDAGILSGNLVTRGAFEWYIINISSGASTIAAAATGHTLVGLATVAANSQASFRTVKTATSTFITYRIS
jgi:hypothetical protein